MRMRMRSADGTIIANNNSEVITSSGGAGADDVLVVGLNWEAFVVVVVPSLPPLGPLDIIFFFFPAIDNFFFQKVTNSKIQK